MAVAEPRDDLINNLRCLAAIHAVGLLDSRRIPPLATWLLSHGLDARLIVELAGMDLEPFLAIDASELFDEALFALSVLPFERRDEVRIALAAASAVHLDQRLNAENMMAIGVHLAVRYDYVDDVMGLVGLQDEWEGAWGRPHDAITTEVREIALDALRRAPEVLACNPEVLNIALRAEAAPQ
jgi:hypothetical protein